MLTHRLEHPPLLLAHSLSAHTAPGGLVGRGGCVVVVVDWVVVVCVGVVVDCGVDLVVDVVIDLVVVVEGAGDGVGVG